MSESNEYDISVNVTCHAEGDLLWRSFRGILACINCCEANGVRVQINLLQDRPTASTKHYVEQIRKLAPKANIYQNDFGDISLNRNFGIQVATGKYIAIFDADDFMSLNWLLDCYRFAERLGAPCLLQPSYLVEFGRSQHIVRFQGSTSPGFLKSNLIEYNSFVAQGFVHRDVFRDLRYRPTPRGSGFGFEDWCLNCDAIAAGFDFHVVPDTIFLYRKHRGGRSLLDTHLADFSVPNASPLFEPERFLTLQQQATPSPRLAVKPAKRSLARRVAHSAPYKVLIFRPYRRMSRQLKQLRRRRVEQHDFEARQALLQSHWHALSRFEPEIKADRNVWFELSAVAMPRLSPVAKLYGEFISAVGTTSVDHLFVLPEAPSDKLIRRIQALNQEAVNCGERAVVLIPLDEQVALPTLACPVVPLDCKDSAALSFFVFRLVQYFQVRKMSIVDGPLGYEVLNRYARQLRHHGVTVDGYLEDVSGNVSIAMRHVDQLTNLYVGSAEVADYLKLVYNHENHDAVLKRCSSLDRTNGSQSVSAGSVPGAQQFSTEDSDLNEKSAVRTGLSVER